MTNINSINLFNLLNFNKYINFSIIYFPLILILIISILAEINRTPFDLSEGESELVSGFNIEYSRRKFILIFLAEYSRIIFIIILFCLIIFFSFNLNIIFYIKIILIIFFIT